jgi:hypothetical protein
MVVLIEDGKYISDPELLLETSSCIVTILAYIRRDAAHIRRFVDIVSDKMIKSDPLFSTGLRR